MPQPATMAPAGPFMRKAHPKMLQRPHAEHQGRHVSQAPPHLRWGLAVMQEPDGVTWRESNKRGGQTVEGERQAE